MARAPAIVLIMMAICFIWISAFATESRIVLGQEKVSDKSNEITAIPKMLDWLDVKGHIMTIDAMAANMLLLIKLLKKKVIIFLP